ncbi:calmodulin-binding protein 60 B-like isoform X2 [Rutidosis leptorrhynchoides]|uniref:calmodulin-binding protein 60 B-like isoform X2 n=1 Tax=Rutidosis leptorrhynchoides TaxID=125765 RepID=UPI003A9957C8
MQTRNMERTNSIRERGKRGLEGEDEHQQAERKRPALASVIVEALKVDSLQKLCSSLEPILRRVVSEEVERALAKLGPASLSNGRASPKRIEGPDGRNLQLHFKSRMSLPLFTGGKVEGEQGAAIHIVLVDANTGHVFTSGPESSIKLDVVVLEGDFNNEDKDDWTQEEFDSHVVKEREGKRPLLTGELQVMLKEGVGTLGELTFTDNSSWIRSRKFRLGLKVASGFCEGIRVREAKTEAFLVKDHRGELYKKHYPPALNDEVWRLEKIGKDGSFHKRLNKAGIFFVEDFLRLVVRDHQKLRTILGSGMSNKMWDALLEHAKTCVPSGKLYVYYAEDNRNVGVVFNHIYELSGLIASDEYQPVDSLSEGQKVYVDTLVKKAYDNWNQVVEYDGKSLVSFKQPKRSSASRNDYSGASIEYPRSSNNQLLPPRAPVVGPSESLSVDSNLLLGGYNDNFDTVYQTGPQVMNTNPHGQYDIGFASNGRHIANSQQIQNTNGYDNISGPLGLGPPQSTSFQTMNSSVPQSNMNIHPFNEWSHNNEDKGVEDLMSEEEIRMRSNEMLENEDMQQLLRLFSMGGGGGHASNVSEDGFSFPSFMPSPAPNFDFDNDRGHSGKAVVGWLKIKAAMRWGFFVRKKAAERRAQIVQLEDDE